MIQADGSETCLILLVVNVHSSGYAQFGHPHDTEALEIFLSMLSVVGSCFFEK